MRQKKAKYFRREARNLEGMMHNREEIREKLLTVHEWGDKYKAIMKDGRFLRAIRGGIGVLYKGHKSVNAIVKTKPFTVRHTQGTEKFHLNRMKKLYKDMGRAGSLNPKNNHTTKNK